MATTLKVRSGSTLVHDFEYRDKDGELVDTTNMVGRFQARDRHNSRRVIFSTEDSVAGGILSSTAQGQWTLTLGPDLTKMLPSTVTWELEVETTDGQVTTVDTGVIKVEPEEVISS